MDVHAPHEPIHSWRDFLLHLITITIGLLIALGLEAVVESIHHRHLLHTAQINLSAEFQSNRDLLARDERQIDATERELQHDVALLVSRKSDPTVAEPLAFSWQWNSLDESAWNTARDSAP